MTVSFVLEALVVLGAIVMGRARVTPHNAEAADE